MSDIYLDSVEKPDSGGVRRMNKNALYFIGFLLLCFTVFIAVVAVNKMESGNREMADEDAKNAVARSSRKMADDIMYGYDGIIPPELEAKGEVAPQTKEKEVTDKTQPPMPDVLIASENLGQMPRDQLPVYDEHATRILQMRMQQMEQAMNSSTPVDTSRMQQSEHSAPRRSPTTRDEMLSEIAQTRAKLAQSNNSGDVNAVFQERLRMLQGGGNINPVSMDSSSLNSLGGGSGVGGDNVAFLQENQGQSSEEKWNLGNGTPAPPRTPYEIRTGTLIPAVLQTGINSDLPGTVIAHVSQNVYDTATGRHLVIPQGTKLIGEYNSNIIFGQERVLMAWQRLIFPDGKALDMGTMPAADVAGYSGFSDQVNHHYFRIFANAFLLSGVIASIDISQNDKGSGNSQRASDSMSESLGQVLGQAVAQMLMKNLNIAPTIEIRQGYRFNVLVTKDIPFSSAYKPFNYR